MIYYETYFIYPTFQKRIWLKSNDLTDAGMKAAFCLQYDDALIEIRFQNPYDKECFGLVTRDASFEYTEDSEEAFINSIGDIDSEIYLTSDFKTYIISIEVNDCEFAIYTGVGFSELKKANPKQWIDYINKAFSITLPMKDTVVQITVDDKKDSFFRSFDCGEIKNEF